MGMKEKWGVSPGTLHLGFLVINVDVSAVCIEFLKSFPFKEILLTPSLKLNFASYMPILGKGIHDEVFFSDKTCFVCIQISDLFYGIRLLENILFLFYGAMIVQYSKDKLY